MLKAQLKCPNKILLITDLYPINYDKTIPFAIEDFALALRDFGFEISVIRPNFLFNTILRRHRVYKQGIYKRKEIKIYNKNFFLPFVFNNFTPSDNFDLIISHMPSGTIYADLLNKKLKLPHISIVHNSDLKVLSDFKYSLYFKKRLMNALKNSDYTGARNSNLKNKLKADFILPSFIDKKYILDKKIPAEKLKIITVSRLIKRKNVDMVINALNNLNFDFEYNIYGEGTERKNLEKLVKKYNLQNKIKFHGKLEHNLIWEKLDSADVFALPSKDETFGLCYLEAMARGLITIAKKGESMDDIIENKKNGFLVENVSDIKNILEDLTLNKKQKIINSTLLNIKNFEKEKVISAYADIIEKCITAHRL